MPCDRKNVVVIALGNRLRGDDGIGPFVADSLHGRLPEGTVIEGIEDALAMMSAWENAALAIVVDAAASGAPPGTIHRLEVGARPLPRELGRCSSHGLGLAEALALSAELDRLPTRLVVYAVEAGTFEPGAELSPRIVEAGEQVVREIRAEVASAARV